MAKLAKTDDYESAQNTNDKMAMESTEDNQTQLDDNQAAAILLLKGLTDSKKELSQNSNASEISVSQKEITTPAVPTIKQNVEKNVKNTTIVQIDPPMIKKLQPVKAPKKYKQDANANKNSVQPAAKPAPKVEKEDSKLSANKEKQSLTQQTQPQSADADNENEQVETSSEVLADDFDSDSHSIHSLAQRSRLADNMQDDADKYDFADNYQQTEDDVDSSQLEDTKYVQEADKYEKDAAVDVQEEEDQVQTESTADEYD